MTHAHSIAQPAVTHPFQAFVELRIFLSSELSAVSPFIDQAMRFVARFRIKDGSEIDIEIALREALLNAMIHGNRQDPGTRVFVVIRCSTDGEVLITIRDQGHGFDSSAVPDPTAPENLMSTSGRGISLMRACMDEVWFEEGGTVVCMRKNPKTRLDLTSSFDPCVVAR
jgi:serine/threonine-protein kinase RsbW